MPAVLAFLAVILVIAYLEVGITAYEKYGPRVCLAPPAATAPVK